MKKSYLLRSFVIASLFSTTLIEAEVIKSYFKRGELKAVTHYVDGTHTEKRAGIKNGLEEIYYIEGPLAYRVNYVDGKRDGLLEWFDKKGRLLAKVHYKEGKLHGEEIHYFENGVVKYRVTYVNDKKEGLQKEYHDNGELALVVPYKHGKKEGLQQEYTYTAALYSEVLYKNNYKEGLQIWYDTAGNVTKTERYKMDRPVAVMKAIQQKKAEPNILVQGIDFSPKKVQ